MVKCLFVVVYYDESIFFYDENEVFYSYLREELIFLISDSLVLN